MGVREKEGERQIVCVCLCVCVCVCVCVCPAQENLIHKSNRAGSSKESLEVGWVESGITKGGSITVLLTSFLAV